MTLFDKRALVGTNLTFFDARKTLLDEKISLNVSRRRVRPACIAGVLTEGFCSDPRWSFWWGQPVSWDTLASYPLRTWLGLGILGLFSWELSMVLLFWLLSGLEVMQVSISFYLISFFGVALAALFLHERISTSIIAGAAPVIAGTTLIWLSDQKQSGFSG